MFVVWDLLLSRLHAHALTIRLSLNLNFFECSDLFERISKWRCIPWAVLRHKSCFKRVIWFGSLRRCFSARLRWKSCLLISTLSFLRRTEVILYAGETWWKRFFWFGLNTLVFDTTCLCLAFLVKTVWNYWDFWVGELLRLCLNLSFNLWGS